MKKEAIEKIKELQATICALGENLIHKEVRRDLMGILLMLEESVDNINTHTHIVVRNDGTYAMSNGVAIQWDGKIEDNYCVMVKYDSDSDKIVESECITLMKHEKIKNMQKEMIMRMFGSER